MLCVLLLQFVMLFDVKISKLSFVVDHPSLSVVLSKSHVFGCARVARGESKTRSEMVKCNLKTFLHTAVCTNENLSVSESIMHD